MSRKPSHEGKQPACNVTALILQIEGKQAHTTLIFSLKTDACHVVSMVLTPSCGKNAKCRQRNGAGCSVNGDSSSSTTA